jgi:hypothetical protein
MLSFIHLRSWFQYSSGGAAPATRRRRPRPVSFDVLEGRLAPSVSVVRASTDNSGAQLATGAADGGSISGDGRFVVFSSAAPTAPFQTSVFVKDLQTGATTLVSSDSNGLAANASARTPVISRDGQWVAFVSSATNLVSDGMGGGIFLKNLTTHVTTRVVAGSTDAAPAISADGHFVAFEAMDNTLVTGDTSTHIEIFRKDTTPGGGIIRISTASSAPASFAADGDSTAPTISDDGNTIAFVSAATNLVTGDTNGVTDIFVKNVSSGATVRADVSQNGTEANGVNGASDPVLSGDGNTVVFQSGATNLVTQTAFFPINAFAKNLSTGAIQLVNTSSTGAVANQPIGASLGLSGDGTVAAFSDSGNNLGGPTGTGTDQVYTKNLVTGVTTPISVNASNQFGTMDSEAPCLSTNGQVVSFSSSASNLVANDTNNCPDIFVAAPAAATPPPTQTQTTGNSSSSGATQNSTPSPTNTQAPPAIASGLPKGGAVVAVSVKPGHAFVSRHSLLADFTGTNLTLRLVKKPPVGKLVVHANGTFTYTPPKKLPTKLHHKVTFQVAAFDGVALSKPLTVTLKIA